MTQSRPVHTTTTPNRPVRPGDEDLFEGPRATSDGIPIIEVQRGQAPAPNPASGHKLVDFKFLQMILLGDREGTVRWRCSNFKNGQDGERCWRDDFDNPRSAVSHLNSHGQIRTPDYSIETLRLACRLVNIYKAVGKRNYATLAANELNRLRVETVGGEPWNASQLSALYAKHNDRFRFTIRREDLVRYAGALDKGSAAPVLPAVTTTPRPATPTIKETSVPSAAATSKNDPTTDASDVTLAELSAKSVKLVKEAASLFDLHREFTADLANFIDAVGTKLADAAARPDVDPDVVEKARKWDKYLELRQLIES